jgi:uncharacterized Zn-finger protein
MNPARPVDNINLQALLLTTLQQHFFLLASAQLLLPMYTHGGPEFVLPNVSANSPGPVVDQAATRKRKLGEPVQPKPLRYCNRKDDCDAFICRTCNRGLKTKTNLTRHMKKHTGEKPFSCTYCRLRFAESTALKRHLRTHTGEKPCVCHYEGCSKAFADISNLRRHIMTHTGEKPFQCRSPDCPRHFSRRSSLKTHMLCIHSMTLAEDDTGEALSDSNPRPRKSRFRPSSSSSSSPSSSASSSPPPSDDNSGSSWEENYSRCLDESSHSEDSSPVSGSDSENPVHTPIPLDMLIAAMKHNPDLR